MTIGAPNIEVIALIGKTNACPGNWVNISQKSIKIAPTHADSNNKFPCLLVRNNNLAICGTARPINAIGPTKAVAPPAKILVAKIIVNRVFLTDIPILAA